MVVDFKDVNLLKSFKHKEYGDSIIQFVFNEIGSKLDKIQEDIKHHPSGNTLAHTISAFNLVKNDNLNVKLAVLLHDIGKTLTPKELQPKHYGHDIKGVALIEKLEEEFKQKEQKENLNVYIDWDFVKKVCRFHMYRNELLNTKHLTKKLYKLTCAFANQEDKIIDYWTCVLADLKSEGYRTEIPVKLYNIIGKSMAICKYVNSKEFNDTITTMIKDKKINIDSKHFDEILHNYELLLIERMIKS